MNSLRYLSGVATLKLNRDDCVGCGMCELVCPHGVFRMEDGKISIRDHDACMECGACARNCPTAALGVTPGVGCAEYIMRSWIKGKSSATCGGPSCC